MNSRTLHLSRVVIYLSLAMIVAGLLLHPVRWETLARGWHNILARPGKMLALRFILQPAVSSSLAIRDGIRDARAARPPFLSTLLLDSTRRGALAKEALDAVATIMLVAIALDVIYQLATFKTVYPIESLIIGLLLGLVPYSLIRGPTARIARLRKLNATR
jgi:hypothetical protein